MASHLRYFIYIDDTPVPLGVPKTVCEIEVARELVNRVTYCNNLAKKYCKKPRRLCMDVYTDRLKHERAKYPRRTKIIKIAYGGVKDEFRSEDSSIEQEISGLRDTENKVRHTIRNQADGTTKFREPDGNI